MDVSELAPHVLEAIAARDLVTRPISDAISALDLTWEIAGGNLAELDRVARRWEGSEWRRIHSDFPEEHRYHRELLRGFHNFLASAIAAVSHADRLIGKLPASASGLSSEFAQRLQRVRSSAIFQLLSCLRDYSIHTGHHSTVLVLRGTGTDAENMELVGSVHFELKMVRGYLEEEKKRARSTRKRDQLDELLELLAAFGDTAEARRLFETYYAEVGDLLRWLRKALVDFNQSAYNRPLKSWSATPETWDALDMAWTRERSTGS